MFTFRGRSFFLFSSLGMILSNSLLAYKSPYDMSWSAKKKQIYQYRQVEETVYDKLPGYLDFTCWEAVQAMAATINLGPAFNHEGDEMPMGWLGERERGIHRRGSVGLIAYHSIANSYTGMLSEPMVIGSSRCSLAAPPDGGFIPGEAVKFYVDGKPSVNLHFMNAIDGQGNNHAFFDRDFFTSIGEPTRFATKLIGLWFSTLTWEPNVLSIRKMASIKSNGEVVVNPKVPKRLIFRNPASFRFDPNTKLDFREVLASILPGTVLKEIYAVSDAGVEEKIGWMTLTAPLLASDYGDQHMFFQHHSDTLRSWRNGYGLFRPRSSIIVP